MIEVRSRFAVPAVAAVLAAMLTPALAQASTTYTTAEPASDAATMPEPLVFPRELSSDLGKVVVYTPQIDTWKDYAQIEGRIAVAVTPTGEAEAVFGVAEFMADDPTLNDGSSRLGLRLGRELRDGRTLFGRIEWKTNLVDSDSQFAVSDGEASDGIVTSTEESDSVLSTRLGYLGLRFENIGELTCSSKPHPTVTTSRLSAAR